MTKVKEAEEFMMKAHEGQKSLDGTPFYLHTLKVGELADVLKPNDEDFRAAARLHDTIEDANVTYKDLAERFGERVANLVNEVTKDSNGNFPNLRTDDGYALKCLDRAHNISRLQTVPWNEEKKKDYKRKTRFEW